MSASITVAFGDAPGPEILEAVLYVLREGGAELEIETIEIGSRIYSMGSPTGILPSAHHQLSRTHVLLKGLVELPEHEYFRDVTVFLREAFALEKTETLRLEGSEFAALSYIGESLALFEPAEASFPAALLAAAMMLRHIGQVPLADAVQAALAGALSKKKRYKTPQLFAEAIVARLPVASPRPLLYNPA